MTIIIVILTNIIIVGVIIGVIIINFYNTTPQTIMLYKYYLVLHYGSNPVYIVSPSVFSTSIRDGNPLQYFHYWEHMYVVGTKHFLAG